MGSFSFKFNIFTEKMPFKKTWQKFGFLTFLVIFLEKNRLLASTAFASKIGFFQEKQELTEC